MIIFEGRAKKPVYLFLEDDDAKLLDAKAFWGKSVWDTEEGIKKRHGDPLIRVASIGIAGEKGVKFACVVNDMHRAAGRSGVGTVMGSKNLKAVAIRGTLGVKVKSPKKFMKAVAAGKKVLADNAVTGQGLPAMGTQVLMNVINEIGALPTRNHLDVKFKGAKNISAEAMAEPRKSDGKANLIRNAACFGCTIGCGRVSAIDRTHYTVVNRPQYQKASGGLEYEAAWALGAATGVDDLDALTFANFICNEQGMDPISFGATVGAAMELYETGVLTKKQTGGIELKFGSARALTDLAELTGKHPGHGARLRHRQPRRLPPAQLHGRLRGPRHPGEDRPADDRRQGRAGEGVPGRHRGGRLGRHLRVHHLCLDPQRHRAADRRRLRGQLDGG
jgi:aldehyde:ferredoxin oxidoreductase